MVDDAARRPLRIIPVATPQGVQAAVHRQVERFQRALAPLRAAAIDRPARSRGSASASASASNLATATAASSHVEPAAAPGGVAAVGAGAAVATKAAAASAPIETHAAAEALADAPPEAAPEADDGAIDADQGGTGGWDDGLVQMILSLCRETDPAIEAWTVTVPLDPRVLPDTALELTLSRHRLSLRFVTQAVEAHRLLSRQRNVLADKLQRGLKSSREIDIEVN